MTKYTFQILFAFLILFSCSNESGLIEEPTKESSYDLIQTKIWDRYCTTCHSSSSAFGRQSNLILTKDKSYDQLVNRSPQNQKAREDGLMLLGTKGLESLATSFLWEKINFPAFDHFYEDHPEYGELMPFGGPALSYGELEYIRKWIGAGAPKTGVVADEALLKDSSRFEIPREDFIQLAPPSQGLQINLGPFEVAANSEREFFLFRELKNSEEIYVNRYEISMREGSHHFILYDYPGTKPPAPETFRDFYDTQGNFNLATAITILNQRFVIGAQVRKLDFSFPEGVALKIPANKGFDLNSHYVNRTSSPKVGQVSVNLHTVEKQKVTKVAQNLFESYQDIFLPPLQTTTLTRTSTFKERMHIFQLTSHAHEHMTEYKIYIEGGSRHGELVYYAKDWEHPPLLNINPPLVLESGQGLKSVATYDNKTSKTLRFGLRSTDEMMIVFGSFYTD